MKTCGILNYTLWVIIVIGVVCEMTSGTSSDYYDYYDVGTTSGPDDVDNTHGTSGHKTTISNEFHFVDLTLVYDKASYVQLKSNDASVRAHAGATLIHLNSIFAPLNIIANIGEIVVWKLQDEIATSQNFANSYYHFKKYRSISLSGGIPNDFGVLITGITSKHHGKFIVHANKMCDAKDSAGLLFFKHSPFNTAVDLASVLGNSLGLESDDGTSCSCPERYCLMHTTSFSNMTSWSSCSIQKWRTITADKSKISCISNMPTMRLNDPTQERELQQKSIDLARNLHNEKLFTETKQKVWDKEMSELQKKLDMMNCNCQRRDIAVEKICNERNSEVQTKLDETIIQLGQCVNFKNSCDREKIELQRKQDENQKKYVTKIFHDDAGEQQLCRLDRSKLQRTLDHLDDGISFLKLKTNHLTTLIDKELLR